MIPMLKARILQAVKAKNTVERDILKLVVSEVERLQNTTQQGNKVVSDSQIHGIIRKIIEGNNITLASGANEKLTQENVILNELVPPIFDQDQILQALQPVIDQIKTASENQAVGVAMKFLKTLDIIRLNQVSLDGNDVKAVVISVRG